MTEYKDAEAIKAQIREVCRDCWTIQRVGGCVMHCGINEAIKAVDAVPSVDAVSVVRCKDRINQGIDELKENGERHSDEVRQNGLLIAKGLRMALRIIREVEENDEKTNKNNSLVGNRNE